MAEDIFARQRLLMGDTAMERLAQATVAVFGVGGVGSYVVEALASVKGISGEEVRRAAWENGLRLYGMGE